MRYILSFFIFTFAAFSASATALSHEEIERIERYLNTITTLQASFEQRAPDGAQSRGTFYLARPGKLRWDYAPPSPILIIANGNLVTYYDRELDEISTLTDQPVASFLARSRVSFSDKDVKLVTSNREKDTYSVTLSEKNKMDNGTLTLVFSQEPLHLIRLEVHDASDQLTSISLHSAQYGVAMESALFRIVRKSN